MWTAASEIARSTDRTLLWFIGISLALLAGITATMVAFAIRYRAEKHPQPQQIRGNLALEITWTVVPTVLVTVMFFMGYGNFKKIRKVPPGSMKISVTGQQWFWSFYYPEHGLHSDRLFVPSGENIALEITSRANDVIHSFYLPDYRIKEDAVPGIKTYMWIKTGNPRSHNIFCAEYCGKDHARMISEMVVLSPEDFKAWVEERLNEQYQPVDLKIALDGNSEKIRNRGGGNLYQTYCQSCHGPAGKGDGLSGARDLTSLDNWKKGTGLTSIFRTVTKGIEGTQMRPFSHLDVWDRFALSHFVATFSGGTRPEISQSGVDSLKKEFQLDQVRRPRQRLPIEKAMQIIAEEAGSGKGR